MTAPVNYAARKPIPAKSAMNGGLNSPHNASVLRLLGEPTGAKTLGLTVTMDVGPFRCTGLKPFLELLTKIFAKVKAEKPALYAAIKTAGCRAVRSQRGSKSVISNHAWGIAIDLYGGKAVVPRGKALTDEALLELYPYFHNEKIYWGAEFPTPDAMHEEVSLELLLQWDAQGLI